MGSVSPLFAEEVIHKSRGHAAADSCSHSVHFYGEDTLFLNSLSEFVGAALGAGGACLVIATEQHRQGLGERLTACGFDLHFAAQSNRYTALDAQETLNKFMVEGWPGEERFRRAIVPELLRARAGPPRADGSIVAFGEMVALLWAEGKAEAAIHLEQLWNKLSLDHSFSLRCAYPMGCFAHESQRESFLGVCAVHSYVVPGES